MARQRGDNTNPDDPSYDPYAARQALLNGLPADQTDPNAPPQQAQGPTSTTMDHEAPPAQGDPSTNPPPTPPPPPTDPTNPPAVPPPTPPPPAAPPSPPAGTPPAAGQSYNAPHWDEIAGYFRDATHGRYTPTQQDISQWGENIDQNYLNTIRQAVYSWGAQWLQQHPDQPASTPTSTTNTPTGWDPDPVKGILAQLNAGLSGEDLASQANSQYKLGTGSGLAVYPGRGPNGSAIYALPNGYFAIGPDGKWGFNPRTEGGGGGGAPSSGTNTGGNPFAFNPTFNPIDTPFNQQMRDMLTKELGVYSTPFTADDPQLAPEIQAYGTQSQRDEQTARDQLAEQAYAESPGGAGLNSGGLDTAIQRNREVAAGNRASFAGNAVAQANSQRRQQLVQMLGQAEQYGLGDQAQQIQQQIALIDAQLREQGLNQGFATSNNNLGFDYAQLQAQLNRDALLYGMTG